MKKRPFLFVILCGIFLSTACGEKSSKDTGNANSGHGSGECQLSTKTTSCTPGVGDGLSSEGPIVICDYAGLKNIQSGLDKHYVLGRDIDARASWSEGEDINDLPCTPYDGNEDTELTEDFCSGMTPLALGRRSREFTGHFDGQNYKICDLYIQTAFDHGNGNSVGLFSSIIGGSIRNVHLLSVRVNNSGTATTGGLVGAAGGVLPGETLDALTLIDNCSVTGKISGQGFVGGLIGNNSSYVSNSYGDVTIEGGITGALIGYNSKRIISCHASGSVTGIGASESLGGGAAGGLVGESYNESGSSENVIFNSYANVVVSGEGPLGPLVGRVTAFHISNSYGVGKVMGNGENVGGLIGSLDTSDSPSELNDNFWDKSTTGQNESFQGDGSRSESGGLDTSSMQQACPEGTTVGICALGDGFVFQKGQYPKAKKCTRCNDGDIVYGTELVGGQ